LGQQPNLILNPIATKTQIRGLEGPEVIKLPRCESLEKDSAVRLRVGNWNVRGLNDEKLLNLVEISEMIHIDMYILTETHCWNQETHEHGSWKLLHTGRNVGERRECGTALMIKKTDCDDIEF